MQVVNFNTVAELNAAGADVLAKQVEQKNDALICAATGSSSTGIYNNFTAQAKSLDTSQLRFIKLDEWAGMPMENPASCEYYLQQYLLQPLQIPSQRYIGFDSEAADAAAECNRIANYLKENGPIDVCILGLGLNGHVAFNEPVEALDPGVRLSELSPTSLNHGSLKDSEVKLTHGYTLGLKDILQAKLILLVVHGPSKKEIMQRLQMAEVSTALPASFLYLHPNAYCYYCEN